MFALSRASAIALTAAVVFLSLAAAGSAGEPPLTHPIDVPSIEDRPILVDTTPPSDRDGDDNDSDGDNGITTGPLTPRPEEPILVAFPDLELNPVDATCIITDRTIWNGKPIIDLQNTGDVTIPMGSKFVVTFSDGTTETYITPWDIKPGATFGITAPSSLLEHPNSTCSVEIEIYVPEIKGDAIP
jgi:hypothetical protein